MKTPKQVISAWVDALNAHDAAAAAALYHEDAVNIQVAIGTPLERLLQTPDTSFDLS